MNPLLVLDAIAFAADAHRGQMYNDLPYIVHPVRVFLKVQDLTDDQEVQAAALLHDVVEDTAISLAQIRDTFGSRVFVLVDALTRRKGEKYFDYITRVSMIEEAKLIKIADLYDNIKHSTHPYAPSYAASLVKRYKAALDQLGVSYD